MIVLAGCNGSQGFRRQSTISETILIKFPAGFARSQELAAAISSAATAASEQRGIAGSVNILNNYQGNGYAAEPAPSASEDPYLTALRDAQTHAAEIAKSSGLPLGRITSVHQQTPPPPYARDTRVMLEVDYGPNLSVVGVSSAGISQQSDAGPGEGLRVYVMGTGPSPQDARNSVSAFEDAVRKSAMQAGIGASDFQIQGGQVNTVQ